MPSEDPTPPGSVVEATLFGKLWSGRRLTPEEQLAFFEEQEMKLKNLLKQLKGVPDNLQGLMDEFFKDQRKQPSEISAELRFLCGTQEPTVSWIATALDAYSTLSWVQNYLRRLPAKLPPIQQRAILMAFCAGAKLGELHTRIETRPDARKPGDKVLDAPILRAAAAWTCPANSSRKRADAKYIRDALIADGTLKEKGSELEYRDGDTMRRIEKSTFPNIVTAAFKEAAAARP